MATDGAHDGLRAAHDVIAARRDFHLEARDIALIVLLYADIESGTAQGFVTSAEDLRALWAKVDLLEGLGTTNAERRLTESINRLLRADCLVRADMVRVKQAEHSQYQLTSLGEALAAWHVQQVRIDGEPLGAILAAFNVQMTAIHDKAQTCTTEPVWTTEVSAPMRYAARELLAAVTRHQRLLDRAHEEIRGFVPSLLKESSEDAIDRCKDVLDTVMRTIRDLLGVTIDVSNVAFGVIDRIQDIAEDRGYAEATPLCEDMRRRLESIVEWTTQRNSDWGSHYDTVHSYLRFVAMVDRSRKVTDALKRSIADVPDWSLRVVDAPRHMYLAERPTPPPKTVIRRARQDFSKEVAVIAPDQLPQRLREISDELLLQGSARWSEVVLQASEVAGLDRVIPRLPEVMHYLLSHGSADNSNRVDVSILGGLTMEELEVRKR